jgi:hypothetical protein
MHVRVLFASCFVGCAEPRYPPDERPMPSVCDSASSESVSATQAGTEQTASQQRASSMPNRAPLKGADEVVASLRKQFKGCYQAGLNADSAMEGRIVIKASLASTGGVETADVAERTGLSESVATCLVDVVRSAQFCMPETPSLLLKIPITFRRERL